MKKIFRMALVFALAGATLMYTGCTKDYSEEINGLGSDVASLNSNLQALQQDLSTLKSSVSALESAYKAADAALQKAIDANSSAIATNSADIAALKTAVDALKLQIAADETKIAANEAAIKKLEEASKTHATKDELNSAVKALQDDIAELAGQVKKQGEEFTTALNAVKVDLDAAKAAIALNEAAIKANGEAIIKNAEDIKANAEAIALAQAAITAAEGRIAAAEAGIAANAEAIAANKKAVDEALENALALIAANKDAIAANAEQIEAALAAIAKNKAAIEVNKKAIEDVLALALENKGNIAENKAAIDLLKEAVEANATKIAAVEELANANKEAIAANKLAIDANTADIATNRANIEANATEIAFIKENYATKDDLQKVIDDLAAANEELGAFKAVISNELRSIVFLPDFYFAGIEATSFTTSTINPIEAVTKEVKFASNGTSFVLPKGQKSDWTAQLKADKKTPVSYELSQLNVANYDINPSTFNVEDAEWALFGMDREYVVKADAAKTWAPVFEGIAVKDGIAEVSFSIANPELLIASITDREKTNVPVMQLVATLEDGKKTVSSDWEAIVPDHIQFKELAFFTPKDAKEADYKTVRTTCDIKNKDLYATAQKALEALKDPEANYGGASVPVYYNCGEFDLTNLVNIHMVKDGKVIEKTLDELVAKYPDLAMNFELVDYTIGDNKTSESMYGKIEGKTFYPCYVKTGDKPSQELCGTDGQGKSSIGRFPLVLVTLTNDKDVVLSGYFVIELTEEEILAGKDVQEFTIKDFGSFPYICAAQKDSTTWDEFSDLVLEKLNKSYNEFIKTYKIMTPNGAVELQQGNTYTAQLFVKTVDEEGNVKYEIAYELDEEGEPTTTPVNFGTVTYTVDKKGNGVNDKFVWEITKAAAENIGEGQDVYVLFQISEFSQIYFKFSAAIAAPAEITYGKINPAYWFNDVEAKAQNTVRANVLVPQKTDDKVENFIKNIDDYFIGNKLNVQLAEASEEVYAKYFDDDKEDNLITKYSYKFAEEQPVIDGKPLYVSADGLTLRLVQDKDGDGKFDTDEDGNYINGSDIAKINGTVITYQKTYWAKYLLNLWGKEAKDPAEMLYANILVEYTAGDDETCVVAKGSDVFHVRFIRPLEVKKAATKELVDAIPGGSVIYLGDLINATDWNDNEKDNIWSYKNNMFVADTYKTAASENIIWFNYYGIESIVVDAKHIKTNQTGEFKLLSEVNKAAKAYLAELKSGKFEEVENGITGELSANTSSPYQIEGLTKYVFYYENNMGVVKDFKLSVPVKINYKWGTLKAEVEIPVKATYKEN